MSIISPLIEFVTQPWVLYPLLVILIIWIIKQRRA